MAPIYFRSRDRGIRRAAALLFGRRAALAWDARRLERHRIRSTGHG